MRLKAGSLRAPLLVALLAAVAVILAAAQPGIAPVVAVDSPASVGSVGGAQQDGSVEEDRAALVAFYHATNGDRWRKAKRAGWLTDAPLGEWDGVDTDRNGRVTVLDRTESGLRGYIPAELGNLSNLTALYLDYNRLSGELPAELGNLSNLTALYLHDNDLSGPLSPALGGLINLTELDVVNNNFTGWIPPELGGLINMKVVWLAGNDWVGCIPDALRNVPENDLNVLESELNLDFCDPLPAVPSFVGGNNFLVKLRWDPSSDVDGYLVRVYRILAPDEPIREAYLSADAYLLADYVEATVALSGGKTYEFQVCAYTGTPPLQTSCDWSERKIFAVGEQDFTEALVVTLRDDLDVVYLMDTSGSMAGEKIAKLKQALARIRDYKEYLGYEVKSTRAALVDFDTEPRVVFNLTETGSGSWIEEWDEGIASLDAYGGTNMYSALQFASNMLPVCPTDDTSCRKREIVLMSDGQATDPGGRDDALEALEAKGIVVRTFAFGFGSEADDAALRYIASQTGGHFTDAQ